MQLNLKKLATILTIFYVIIGLLSLPFILMSPMLFDAPGSENNTALWVFFWALITMPLTIVFAIVYSAIRRDRDNRKACLIYLLPTIQLVIAAGAMAYIEIFCNGMFSC